MSGKDWQKPTEHGKRDPLSNQKQNAAMENPPRYAELGGLKSGTRGAKRNNMNVRRPGGTNG